MLVVGGMGSMGMRGRCSLNRGLRGFKDGWDCGGWALRASPCGLAALVRVPLTLKRRGTGGFLPAQE